MPRLPRLFQAAPRLFLVLGLLFAAPMLMALSDPAEMLPNHAEELRAERLGSTLRCMVCQNESIEESDADLARDIRRIVRQQIAEGRTDQQILAWLHARYGDFILLKPPFDWGTALLWGSPVVALVLGLCIVVLRRRHSQATAPLSAEEAARLRALEDEERA